MPGMVPPTIEPPKTVIGIGSRELILLGAGLLAASLVILSPLALIPRMGAAALLFGGSALAALGRAPASGKTVETFLLDLLRFHGRGRLLQRNTGDPGPGPDNVVPPRVAPPPADRLQFEALPLDASGVLGLLSVVFLLMLLAWIWSGELGILLLRLGMNPGGSL